MQSIKITKATQAKRWPEKVLVPSQHVIIFLSLLWLHKEGCYYEPVSSKLSSLALTNDLLFNMKNSLSVTLNSKLMPICLPALLGALLTFAFAPFDIFPLAVLAPAGLLALWLKVTPSAKRAFWMGFSFGMGLFGAGVYWVFISIHLFGDVPIPLAILITLGMVAILALFPAMTGYCLNRYFPINTTEKIVCAFPALWVASEWIRGWFLTGFPWLYLGYSQTNSPLRGYAPILSVYLVSFMVVLSSALAVNAFLQYKQKNFRSLYLNLFALTTIWILGSLFSLIPWTKPQGQPISVALVQGNIPQAIKWSPEHVQLSLDTYAQLTQPLWGKYKLIIWPEAAIPLPLQNAQTYVDELDQKAITSGSDLLLGIPIGAPDQQGYYNAIATLGSAKKVYLKRHLVPFGEYTPLSNFFAKALQFMNIPMSEMVPGNYDQGPLTVGGMKILPSICYEIAFPEMNRFLDKSIGALLVVTNDAWFGNSSAEPQHLQMAAMRALELGRPLLFVSNDGITAILDANGRVAAAAPQRKATVLESSVQPMYGITPWMRNGTDPIFVMIICLLFMAVRANKRATGTTTKQIKTSITNKQQLANE